MTVKHAFSNPVADATGTVTVWNGATTATVAASQIVKPSNWNSNHDQYYTLSGNTTIGSTASGTNVVFVGAGDIVVGGSNNSQILISRNAPLVSFYNPHDEAVLVAGQIGNQSLHVQARLLPAISFDRVAFPVLLSNSSNSTGTATISMRMGFYTKNGASLSLVASQSTTQAVTYSGTNNNSTYAGMRHLTMGFSTSLSEGLYYVAIHSRTATGGANCTISQFLRSQINSAFSGILGEASNSTRQLVLGMGIFSSTFSTNLANSIGISHLQGTTSIQHRSPAFLLMNGTH